MLLTAGLGLGPSKAGVALFALLALRFVPFLCIFVFVLFPSCVRLNEILHLTLIFSLLHDPDRFATITERKGPQTHIRHVTTTRPRYVSRRAAYHFPSELPYSAYDVFQTLIESPFHQLPPATTTAAVRGATPMKRTTLLLITTTMRPTMITHGAVPRASRAAGLALAAEG